jgi:hypothetical protein
MWSSTRPSQGCFTGVAAAQSHDDVDVFVRCRRQEGEGKRVDSSSSGSSKAGGSSGATESSWTPTSVLVPLLGIALALVWKFYLSE